MDEVKTESHYGAPILLDQCPQCGGIWFDKEELLATKHGEAERIDLVLDINILTQTKVFKKDSLCKKAFKLSKIKPFLILNILKNKQLSEPASKKRSST